MAFIGWTLFLLDEHHDVQYFYLVNIVFIWRTLQLLWWISQCSSIRSHKRPLLCHLSNQKLHFFPLPILKYTKLLILFLRPRICFQTKEEYPRYSIKKKTLKKFINVIAYMDGQNKDRSPIDVKRLEHWSN